MEGSEAPEGAERSDRTWECVKLELIWLIYANDKKETVLPMSAFIEIKNARRGGLKPRRAFYAVVNVLVAVYYSAGRKAHLKVIAFYVIIVKI